MKLSKDKDALPNHEQLIRDSRLSLLNELKLRLSRITLKSPIDLTQLERSTGSTYIDQPFSRIKNEVFISNALPLDSNKEVDISDDPHNEQEAKCTSKFTISNPSSDQLEAFEKKASHIDNDNEDVTIASSIFNEVLPLETSNAKTEINNFLDAQCMPAHNTLWEQLMNEKKDHHRTLYLLDSLQNMYCKELQKNAKLQNIIDKFRFSEEPFGSCDTVALNCQQPDSGDLNMQSNQEQVNVSISKNSSQNRELKLKHAYTTDQSDGEMELSQPCELKNVFEIQKTSAKEVVDLFVSKNENLIHDLNKQIGERFDCHNISATSDDEIIKKEFSADHKMFCDFYNLRTSSTLSLEKSWKINKLQNNVPHSIQVDQPRKRFKNNGDFKERTESSVLQNSKGNNVKSRNMLTLLYVSLSMADRQSMLLKKRSNVLLLDIIRKNKTCNQTRIF